MELFQAYEMLRKATNVGEVITILKELKNTYDAIEIKLLPADPSDPLNSTYKLAAKVGKDGWFLPTGRGVYDILKEVLQ